MDDNRPLYLPMTWADGFSSQKTDQSSIFTETPKVGCTESYEVPKITCVGFCETPECGVGGCLRRRELQAA